MQQRSFPSGSRQAPDPYDQFLEQNGFYRKHTARDASSLFRVISEQMYDTQMHHLSIRKKCVSYMQKHRKFFQELIERDLDEYLEDMSKPKTCATMIELQAVGLLYQRNVLLFEPFNLGNYFGQHREYFLKVFRVFCTPERHFDSVYTSSFIKDAAICQSLCYELLYKDLFKLPDVKYAVELMLHNSNLEPQQCVTEVNDDGYFTRIQLNDKRTFPLDLPSDTNCILEDSSLCRFHSNTEQEKCKDSEQNVVEAHAAESLLPNKHLSCVRQLLLEGITPFPYKVAKALDPTMYRNIEFDAWNEARKELKFQSWYCGDGNFKIGAKCHVRLSKAENELYTCHIQDISVDKSHCLVFIEQLGEKRLVPYDALSPLPVEQFKPWVLPYRFHRQMQKYNSMRLTRHYSSRFKFNGQPPAGAMQSYCKTLNGSMPGLCNGVPGKTGACIGASFSLDFGDLKQQQQHYMHLAMPGQQHFHNSCIYNLTHLENFRARTYEYCTMPLTVEHNVNLKGGAHDNHNGNGGGSCGVTTTTTVPVESGAAENLDDSNQVATSTVDNGPQDESPGSREVALINHNYALEQTNVTYVPEYPSYYPMQSYVGVPEEFYGFGYEPGMNAQFGSCPNGGMYYMCNPGATAAPGYSPVGNFFPPVQAAPSVLISPTPMAAPQYYSNNAYYMNSAPTAMVQAPLLGQAASVAHTIHESGGNAGATITTPLSGRINYDAKKSVKLNGMDLPTDMATLRYFYNLGVEAHNKRRHSQDSAIGSRDNVNIKEERATEQKDSNHCKTDANNNLPNNSNPKHNASNSTSQMNNSVKPPYGARRFHNNNNHNRYNNVRDRQPQRRNSINIEEASSSGGQQNNNNNNSNNFHQRNYHDYTKNKYQHQNSINERHPDMSRSNGGGNISNMNRHQHPRNERGNYYENVGHNTLTTGGGDGLVDTTTGKGPNSGGDQGDNGQIYASYGQPPPSYEHLNDFHPTPMPANGGGHVTANGNMFIPVHVQQTPTPYSAMYTTSAPTPLNGAILQPMNQSGSGCNTNYGTPHYLGHPSSSPLVQNGYGAPPMNGPGVQALCMPSNPLSSNASESSGGGNNNSGNGDNAIITTQSLQPAIMSSNYGPSIPIYVTPTPANGNTNGQAIIHHSMQAPPPPPPHGGGPQGFWCLPPPTAPAFIPSAPTQVAHVSNVGYVGTVTNNPNHTQVASAAPSQNHNQGTQNRRTQSQPQQQNQQQQQTQQNDKETSQ